MLKSLWDLPTNTTGTPVDKRWAIMYTTHIYTVSVHFLKKWRYFVSFETLLCFRVRAEVSGNTFSVKRVFEQV